MNKSISRFTAPPALALLGVTLCTLLSCMKIHVEPVLAAPELPQASGPVINLMITGSEVDRDDFARAYTVFRFWSSRITNETGSIQSLLAPAVIEKLRESGRRVVLASNPTAPQLKIDVRRSDAFWIPPREFIETPTPHKRGDVRVHFIISTTILSAEREEKLPDFEFQNSQPAFPGEESAMLSFLIRKALRAYIDQLSLH